MNKYQEFALDYFLTDIPEGMSFREIVEGIGDGDLELLSHIWEPFENYPCDEIHDFIVHMALSLESKFGNKK